MAEPSGPESPDREFSGRADREPTAERSAAGYGGPTASEEPESPPLNRLATQSLMNSKISAAVDEQTRAAWGKAAEIALNLGIGAIPGIGPVVGGINALSGRFGGPTLGGLANRGIRGDFSGPSSPGGPAPSGGPGMAGLGGPGPQGEGLDPYGTPQDPLHAALLNFGAPRGLTGPQLAQVYATLQNFQQPSMLR